MVLFPIESMHPWCVEPEHLLLLQIIWDADCIFSNMELRWRHPSKTGHSLFKLRGQPFCCHVFSDGPGSQDDLIRLSQTCLYLICWVPKFSLSETGLMCASFCFALSAVSSHLCVQTTASQPEGRKKSCKLIGSWRISVTETWGEVWIFQAAGVSLSASPVMFNLFRSAEGCAQTSWKEPIIFPHSSELERLRLGLPPLEKMWFLLS